MRDGSPRQRCYRCAQLKPADDFAWRRKEKNQRDSFCRPCRALYKREHYAANKQRYIDRAATRQRELRLARTTYLIEFFKSHPCSDCGEADPVVLEFDHRGNKLFNVGAALASRRWEAILEEMQKCDVVCANCHRRRTARRRSSLRLALTAGPAAN